MAVHIAASIQSPKLISLIKQADPRGQMHLRVVSNERLELGADPFKSSVAIDLKTETIQPLDAVAPTQIIPPALSLGGARATGDYWYEINGNRVGCHSVKALLLQSLTALAAADPQLMENLSKVRKRTKRIVAKDKYWLFRDRNLADKYSVQLENGWWVGTNNSSPEVRAWLGIAASLSPNQKFSTSLG
ncbi:MAG TPA: hypothetical protein VKR31_07860 [Rhizomicrobium sp.]|nr:hypothetical protein [Rhizomicrobium sp.]